MSDRLCIKSFLYLITNCVVTRVIGATASNDIVGKYIYLQNIFLRRSVVSKVRFIAGDRVDMVFCHGSRFCRSICCCENQFYSESNFFCQKKVDVPTYFIFLAPYLMELF